MRNLTNTHTGLAGIDLLQLLNNALSAGKHLVAVLHPDLRYPVQQAPKLHARIIRASEDGLEGRREP